MASYTRCLTVTGKVGIPEQSGYRNSRDTGTLCIRWCSSSPKEVRAGRPGYLQRHRRQRRFQSTSRQRTPAAIELARERLLQLSFSGIGHIRQRPLAVGDEDDWSGANRHRGLSRDRLPTEGIGSSEVEVYDVGRARNPPQAIGPPRSGAAASANLLRSAL